jgi:hypothetical protein
MALISVEGGQVQTEEVKRQLKRLFLGKWSWELKAHEDNSFLAKFPSKVELQRAIAFGGADVKGEGVPKGARLRFELWQEKEVGFLLPKVWVRVFCLRKELCEFLELWAIGSMLGSTQIVDMETTRKSDFRRILVAVLNPRLIPEQLDVVIGDHYFELDFEVENVGFDENGEEAEFEWTRVHEGVGGEGPLEGGQIGEEEPERVPKKLKRGVDGDGVEGVAKDAQGVEEKVLSWKEQIQSMSKKEFEAFLRAKADEIADLATDRVLDVVVGRVMGEEEDGQFQKEVLGDGGMSGGDMGWRWGIESRMRLLFLRPWCRSGLAQHSSGLRMSMSWLRQRRGLPGRT